MNNTALFGLPFLIILGIGGVSWYRASQNGNDGEIWEPRETGIETSGVDEIFQPRYIHLAYGELPTSSMRVIWSTKNATTNSRCKFSSSNSRGETLTLSVTFFLATEFPYIYQVNLTQLTPGTKYHYACGSDEAMSPTYSFTTLAEDQEVISALIYGDLGVGNGVSFPYLKHVIQNFPVDCILHVGDIAYNMGDDNGRVGDAFMDMIEPLATLKPYMTIVGNHEGSDIFRQYMHRFEITGDPQRWWYSLDIGPVHFIFLNTEVFYNPFIFSFRSRQNQWLVEDLKKANTNRDKVPWICTLGHQPMYCSNNNTDDCTQLLSKVREAWEDLFRENSVDVSIWGHEHSYERTLPMYNYTVLNGSIENPYHNPRGLVHVTSGSAGCKKFHDSFPIYPAPEWSAVRSSDYGFLWFKASKTAISFEQYSTNKELVFDSFWITRSAE